MRTRRYAAEFVGTLMIVFMPVALGATGSMPGGAAGLVPAAWVSGLVVLAMVSALGPVSAAHFNPAVTLAFASAGRFPWCRVPGYLLAQFTGGVVAALLSSLVFGRGTGAHVPAAGMVGQAFAVEVVISFALMLVIMAVATDNRVSSPAPALAIGLVVVVGVLIAGPVSGGSMNPARSLGPALLAGGPALTAVWLYLTAPVVGAIAAALAYERLRVHASSAQSAPADM